VKQDQVGGGQRRPSDSLRSGILLGTPAMKRLVAGAITAAMMGLFLWSAVRGGAAGRVESPAIATPPAPSPESSSPFAVPESQLRNLLEAARRGDVDGYIAAFTGSLHDRIEREVRDRGLGGFADDLSRAASARKSHALFAAEPDGPNTCRIVVESVYRDHNERQTYHLERTSLGWLVAAVDVVRSHSPEEEYGSRAGLVGNDNDGGY
jgi:hypothetical protein